MNVSRGFVRMTALAVVLALPVMGMSGVSSAKTAAKVCAKHPNKAKCHKSGGGSGTGGSPAQITVEVDPNPLVETASSDIAAVIQVETLPAFAGDRVNIDSSQLQASCLQVRYDSLQYINFQGGPSPIELNRIGVVLDDDGNATVIVHGADCAPGTSVVEADLEVAPFLTALTTLTALPPVVTPEGVTGYPQIGGVAQEVETGDTSLSGDSDVYAVFYVETNPVYAEQRVEIGSAQLEARCVRAWVWESADLNNVVDSSGANPGTTLSAVIDDDGNAAFTFLGRSCAAGASEVIADVMAGTHPTYVTEFTVDPPAPTI